MSSDAAMSTLIREVLAEELARLKPGRPQGVGTPRPSSTEEYVSITNDADLQAFVSRLVAVMDDGSRRQDIKQGRLVFRLGEKANTAIPPLPIASSNGASTAQASSAVTIENGIFSERQVDQLSRDVTHIRLGKRVKMTPLARDRLRQRGIVIERTEQ